MSFKGRWMTPRWWSATSTWRIGERSRFICSFQEVFQFTTRSAELRQLLLAHTGQSFLHHILCCYIIARFEWERVTTLFSLCLFTRLLKRETNKHDNWMSAFGVQPSLCDTTHAQARSKQDFPTCTPGVAFQPSSTSISPLFGIGPLWDLRDKHHRPPLDMFNSRRPPSKPLHQVLSFLEPCKRESLMPRLAR